MGKFDVIAYRISSAVPRFLLPKQRYTQPLIIRKVSLCFRVRYIGCFLHWNLVFSYQVVSKIALIPTIFCDTLNYTVHSHENDSTSFAKN